MNFLYIALIILLLIIIIILLNTLFLWNKQLKNLIEQIKFMEYNQTNLQINIDIPFNNFKNLINCLNHLLITHRKTESELLKTNKNFKEIITGIAHDLRTPLTSASGYIQMLNKENIEQQQQYQYLSIIQNRILSVQNLQNQLFELARIEANELELLEQKTNINNVLRDTLSMFYDDFFKKNIEPVVEIPEEQFFIIADKDALKRIFENIIYNSLVHGENNYKISSINNGNTYKITFENVSNNIEQEDINYIFDRFYTTDKSRTRKTTGLGLSISKQLVLKMNGHIEALYQNNIFQIIILFPKLE